MVKTIDERIGHALGVGRDIDDETRIAGLVELVKTVDTERERTVETMEQLIDEADDDLEDAQEQADHARVKVLEERLADQRAALSTISLLTIERVQRDERERQGGAAASANIAASALRRFGQALQNACEEEE